MKKFFQAVLRETLRKFLFDRVPEAKKLMKERGYPLIGQASDDLIWNLIDCLVPKLR